MNSKQGNNSSKASTQLQSKRKSKVTPVLGGGDGRWASKLTTRFLRQQKADKTDTESIQQSPFLLEEDDSKQPFFPMDEDLEEQEQREFPVEEPISVVTHKKIKSAPEFEPFSRRLRRELPMQ